MMRECNQPSRVRQEAVAAILPARRKREEGGYAMLLVLLLASLVAISLYKELPRVAFDTQRQREQILIERGEQYKRAIQIFARANNRFPTTLDELENLNAKHFLRHRYKDPMTGKDEWRLVHIAGGVLTDSILNKPKQQTGDQANATDQSQYITQQASIGQSNMDTGQQQNVSAAVRRRASEGGVQLGPDGQPIQGAGPQQVFPFGSGPTGAPADPNAPPGSNPTASGAPPAPGVPGSNPANNLYGTAAGNSSNTNGNSSSGYMSAMPGLGSSSSTPGNSGYPANGGVPGAPVNSQVNNGSPYSTTAGPNGIPSGFSQPGMGMAGQSQAAAMIGNLLMSPRPGGMSGLPGGPQGQVMGGGIAGVASKMKGDSIMIYDDRKDYSEWEFNWDPTKAPPNPPNPNTPTVGTPMSQAASDSGSSTFGAGFANNGMAGMGASSGTGAGNTPAGSASGSSFGPAPPGGPGMGGGAFSGNFSSTPTGNSTFGNTPPGGTSPNGISPTGTSPNGSAGQPTQGGLMGGTLPPNIRPGVP